MFQLTKVWIDQEPGIEMVYIRYLWSPLGEAAKWEGLKLQTIPTRAGHDIEGEGIADDAIYELIQTVPLLRRYLTKVWGPRDTTVEYIYQLLRINSPISEDDFERWDNNQGQNYRVLLTRWRG
ncbi:MAG: hypothetical protein HYZ50_06920 [Deltaproteobacteria bacterium]|nr:hypothetical protein [Deltaproteobacteria bacterium]